MELGRIHRLNDLKTVWPSEPGDFDPWLADNLDQLGEALGLDLELQGRQVSVGPFLLDILARESATGRPVIIENQLTKTNHTHLGQLLTYAAGFDAKVVVWLASEFTDEHRAALDLLNRHTDEEIAFFGVVVEVWKIGDSLPAPNFKVVSAPNQWVRGSPVTDDPQNAYRSFWETFLVNMTDEEKQHIGAKGQPSAKSVYYCKTYPPPGQGLISFASFGRSGPSVEIYFNGKNKNWNKGLFDELRKAQNEVEEELGLSLDWRRLDNNVACRILAPYPGPGIPSIGSDADTLNKVRRWMIDTLLAFDAVFGPRLIQVASTMAAQEVGELEEILNGVVDQ